MSIKIYRLTLSGVSNLYRWDGSLLANGWPVGVESFVKHAGARQTIGRWLDCPNWGVAKKIMQASAPIPHDGETNG